jgi:Ca-activated chloride channel homolog
MADREDCAPEALHFCDSSRILIALDVLLSFDAPFQITKRFALTAKEVTVTAPTKEGFRPSFCDMRSGAGTREPALRQTGLREPWYQILFTTVFFGLLLGSLVAVLAPLAMSQSTDEVHVTPRTSRQSSERPAIEPPGQDSALRMRVGVNLVLVPATVTDNMNRPITHLRKEDFGLSEDDAQQQIRSFSEEDAPLSVGLVLDLSKSMSNKIEMERAAVVEFMRNANPADDYFVISLSDRPRLIADTTDSIEEIERKLGLAVPNGNTALLDGIYLGLAKLRKSRYERRALLVISDGGDNHSHYNHKEIRRFVRESNVLIDSIGIFDNMPVPVFKTIEEKLGKRLLVEITEASGGRTIVADQANKVPQIAATISRELRQQYVLGYKSTNPLHNGKWRKIKVQVIATGNPPVRTYYKKGYYAPEE